MGGSSGGEQEPLWGVVVVTWHLGDQTAVGEDDYHENYCLSFILYMRLTGGVCVVVGSSLQSPRPVLHSLQSIGSHCSTKDQDEGEELVMIESIQHWLEVMGGALTNDHIKPSAGARNQQKASLPSGPDNYGDGDTEQDLIE